MQAITNSGLLRYAAALLLVGLTVSAFAQRPATKGHRTSKVVPPPSVQLPVAMPTVPPPPVPTPEEMPPAAPDVAWDGQSLTISTDNSTLGAVLDAVRAKTGADIDVPSSAAGQRLAAHLGPGSARDVLSALLG